MINKYIYAHLRTCIYVCNVGALKCTKNFQFLDFKKGAKNVVTVFPFRFVDSPIASIARTGRYFVDKHLRLHDQHTFVFHLIRNSTIFDFVYYLNFAKCFF